MRTSLRLAAFASVTLAGVLGACSSSESTSSSSSCTCSADINGDKRTLACGESACVGGQTVSCGTDAKLSQGGSACTGSSSSSGSSGDSGSGSSSSSSSSSSSGGTPTNACDDLMTFCNTKCTTPQTVHDNCVSAAQAGDAKKCVLWQSNNASLCKL